MRTATEILHTTQAKTRTGLVVPTYTEFGSRITVDFKFLITDAKIDNTVQYDLDFCLSCTSETGQQGDSNQRFFHLSNLRCLSDASSVPEHQAEPNNAMAMSQDQDKKHPRNSRDIKKTNYNIYDLTCDADAPLLGICS